MMSATAFSSPDNIQQNIEETDLGENANFNEIWTENNKSLVRNWIQENSFKDICLQFPDAYLKYSVRIHEDLTRSYESTKFYILADTSYGSCCVDEIAAQHVDADSLIHFGNACMSKITRLPVLYLFPELTFDFKDFSEKVKEHISEAKAVCLVLGICYQYILDNNDFTNMIKEMFLGVEDLNLYKYPGEKNNFNPSENEQESTYIYIGSDDKIFFNLSMTSKVSKWLIYDPSQQIMSSMSPMKSKYLRRRYYFIEKCKDAQTLGLVVATLTTDGYLDIVKRIQEMARARNIRTYIISVGRINPAKLANFMEIDCFILIGCLFNNLYTSREFYKPIISIFEAEMALNPAWRTKFPENYVTDFQDLLPNGKYYEEFKSENINKDENDISLVSGRIRYIPSISNEDCNKTDNTLAERKNFEIMEQNHGQQFEDRSWKGLEPKLGETEPVKITKGLSGIPIRYSND